MKYPSAADLAFARQLLAYERGDDDHDATVAERVYDQVHDRLAPVIGSAGVSALFFRSLKLASLSGFVLPEGVAAREGASPGKYLHDHLRRMDPDAAAEAAASVFAIFSGLLTTFIGVKVTTRVLYRDWPMGVETITKETT